MRNPDAYLRDLEYKEQLRAEANKTDNADKSDETSKNESIDNADNDKQSTDVKVDDAKAVSKETETVKTTKSTKEAKPTKISKEVKSDKTTKETKTAKTAKTVASKPSKTKAPIKDTPKAKPEIDTDKVDSQSTAKSDSSDAKASVKAKPVSKKSKPVIKVKLSSKNKDDVKYIKSLPKTMYDIAANMFDNSSNAKAADYVAAYIAVTSGVSTGLTDTQMELYKQRMSGDNEDAEREKVNRILQASEQELQLIKELKFIMSNVLFDRYGFRNDTPSNSSDVNLNEDGLYELTKRISSEFMKFKDHANRREGRPIR